MPESSPARQAYSHCPLGRQGRAPRLGGLVHSTSSTDWQGGAGVSARCPAEGFRPDDPLPLRLRHLMLADEERLEGRPRADLHRASVLLFGMATPSGTSRRQEHQHDGEVFSNSNRRASVRLPGCPRVEHRELPEARRRVPCRAGSVRAAGEGRAPVDRSEAAMSAAAASNGRGSRRSNPCDRPRDDEPPLDVREQSLVRVGVGEVSRSRSSSERYSCFQASSVPDSFPPRAARSVAVRQIDLMEGDPRDQDLGPARATRHGGRFRWQRRQKASASAAQVADRLLRFREALKSSPCRERLLRGPEQDQRRHGPARARQEHRGDRGRDHGVPLVHLSAPRQRVRSRRASTGTRGRARAAGPSAKSRVGLVPPVAILLDRGPRPRPTGRGRSRG